MESTGKRQREYARVPVNLSVRFRPLEKDEEAERIEASLLDSPSVWSPPGEGELIKLADSPNTGSEGVLASALLALTAQVERLSRRIVDTDGPMEVGEIVELSCAGARFSTPLLLSRGSLLLFSLIGDDPEVPPLRLLAEVVHLDGNSGGLYGILFKAIHPTDRDRLTRYVYSLQRRRLREASQDRA